ncbi:ABC transporter permease [Nocardia vaccinii]|uniref:ABC transporter permease n=1 Tax=Nocardia vaccinii TaxID=1822 RepID=UPI00082E5E70|nr:ABC transporter permease [Nocardia vaccinii]
MTTATGTRHRPEQAEPARGASDFAGTRRLLRLYLRRDRVVLPLWVLLLSIPLGSVYVESIEKVYGTLADRVQFAYAINTSPAQLAMYGPVYNTTVGMVGVWKAGVFHTLIAIATILVVIRHTRAEEETGRGELMASTRVGRLANLTAALLVACGGALLTGLIGAASITAAGVPGNGALAFGLAEAGSGIVFAGVAAVAAQLSASARTARGIAFAVLVTTYFLRAFGDVRAADGPAGPLTWLSPQGWSLQVRPYAGDHWTVLLLHIVTTGVLIAAAYTLLRRRDLGAGLIAERPGPRTGGPALSGPFGLAWRLQRGALLMWTLGTTLIGLVFGSLVHGVGNELGSNQALHDIIARLGGTRALEDAFVAIAYIMVGMMATAYSISAALRLHSEENADHAETVLSGAVGRIRWAASHLVYAVAGPAVALVVSGVGAGLVYGAYAHDIRGKLPRVLGAALIQLPAVWVFTGITVLLFGLLPRWAPVAWGIFTAGIAVYLLGSISGMPQWILDCSPYGHLPKLPAESFRAMPVVIMLLIAAVLVGVGAAGFRRRDLR